MKLSSRCLIVFGRNYMVWSVSDGSGSLSANIWQGSGHHPPMNVGVRKLECGIKISAVHHSVLSQYTRLTDEQTDGQNCDSNTVRCITCSRTDPVTRLKLSMGPIRRPYSLYPRHVRASTLPKKETKYSYNAFQMTITEIYLKMTMSHWKVNESWIIISCYTSILTAAVVC